MDLGKKLRPFKVTEPIQAPDYTPVTTPQREPVLVGR
jgi:hypothetical protein